MPHLLQFLSERLIQQEAEAIIEEKGLTAALMYAMRNDKFEVVKYILKTNGQGPDAITALKINEALGQSALGGQLPMVELLLKKYDQTPDAIVALKIDKALRNAASNGHLPVVELLLKKYGQTPDAIVALKIDLALELAVWLGRLPMVELLLNTCIKSNNKTVLESAANLPDLNEFAQKANTPLELKQLIDKIPETIKRIELDEVMNPAVQKMQARTNKLSILQARAGENKTNIKALAQQLQELGESVLSPFKLGGE